MEVILDIVIYETSKLQQLLIELKIFRTNENKIKEIKEQIELVKSKLEHYLIFIN